MNDLAAGFQEICLGRTEASFEGRTLFFHHQNLFDQFKVDKVKEKHRVWAASRLGDREDSVRKAIDKGLWSEAREKQLENQKNEAQLYLSRGRKTKFTSFDVIRSLHEGWDMMRNEINRAYAEKTLALQAFPSCDSYARDKAFDYEIYLSAKNENGSQFFEEEEFDNLSDMSLSLLRNEYFEKILKFDEMFFKRMAVCPFFYTLFDHCAVNPADFFRKPICDLSFFQTSLLDKGKSFNDVLKHCHGAPEDFFQNPDMLITLAIQRNNGTTETKSDSAADIKGDFAQFKRNR